MYRREGSEGGRRPGRRRRSLQATAGEDRERREDRRGQGGQAPQELLKMDERARLFDLGKLAVGIPAGTRRLTRL